MRELLKLLDSKISYQDYGVSEGDKEVITYECPCGKGTIVQEHKNAPGFKEDNVFITCKKCKKVYEVDVKNGARNWDLKSKKKIDD